MGYTIYFKNKVKQTDEDWNEFIIACKKLYKNMPKEIDGKVLSISGCSKAEKPIFNNNHVWFNGSDGEKRIKEGKYWKDSTDKELEHETFVLSKKPCHESCKTNRKPYTFMVMAVLILAKTMLKDIHFLDAGAEWQDSLVYVNEVCRNNKTFTLLMFPDKLKENLFD